ncbi:MAG: glycosyltransferase family 2 protein [Alphaproteobacteria bacterium]|nr:glycosyltransferase family 2 protein [Alphaproteobacteria bacterium]
MRKKTVHSPRLVSLVLPCFNEGEALPQTLPLVLKLCESIVRKGFAYQLVLVDDGSRDNTRAIIKQHCQRNPHMTLVGLSRNFGHQLAALAGIEQSVGDAGVLMDADLQDPPEVVLTMIEKWQAGADVVYGVRRKRLGETIFKRGTAFLFYRLLNRLSDWPIPPDVGDFRLMSRRVVSVLQQMPERSKFLRGMVAWIGFRQDAVHFTRHERVAGDTKYPFRKMIKLAMDGVFSFSVKPLRLATIFGFIVSLLALLGIGLVIWQRFFTDHVVSGWSALMVTMLFLGGVQLIVMGILGEYVGRIYNEAKGRPVYIIAETMGEVAGDKMADQTVGKTDGKGSYRTRYQKK